jgi:serine/threonine protein kinase
LSLVGQTVGNYKVTSLLGEGGMGIVYLAEHPVIGRKVAIKVLHVALSRDTEVVARFFNEARAIHTIGHEHIVEIMDFGQTADGQPYFIMEYLVGESMNDRISRGAIPAPEVAEIAEQICQALQAAHDKGVIHRDLKPHNVQLLGTTRGRMQVKLLDFGVAKIMNLGDGSQSVKTRTGSLMGTPLYMSPEQCKGSGKLDHRTDIYSLGVMLFEMLAGRPPFVAEGVGELFAKHMLEAPPQLAELAPETPPAMAAAIMRSLAKNLEDRFSTMEEFRRALLGEIAVSPVPTTASGRTRGYRSVIGGAPPAQQTSTTLSAASSAIDDELPPRKGRAGLVIAGVALAGAAAAVFMLATRPSKGNKAAAGDPGASVSAEGAPAAAPSPNTVTIRFEAEPAGAHLIRTTDDKDLGVVPVELRLPRDGGRPEYVLRLDGYKDKPLIADLGRDQTLRVSLERQPPAPPPAVVPAAAADSTDKPAEPLRRRTTPVRRPAHRGHGQPGDEDGLATPNF